MYLSISKNDELAGLIQAAEQKSPEDLTEEDKMALLGRPKAGETARAVLRIIESKEFKSRLNSTLANQLCYIIGNNSLAEEEDSTLLAFPVVSSMGLQHMQHNIYVISFLHHFGHKIYSIYGFKLLNTIDKLVQRANASMVLGTSSWKEQFVEALTVTSAEEAGGGEEEDEEPRPTCANYVMHFITLFWKILFAFVPPTGKTSVKPILI
uniref:Uncharacterized protein n=1 Tax=Glossina brevipalpis TaxID=37001 RepID=A0A1A9WFR9_9MUSC